MGNAEYMGTDEELREEQKSLPRSEDAEARSWRRRRRWTLVTPWRNSRACCGSRTLAALMLPPRRQGSAPLPRCPKGQCGQGLRDVPRLPRIQNEDVRVGLSHKKTFLVPGAVEDGTPCFLSIVNRHVVRDCPTDEAELYAEYSFRRIANLLDREGYEKTVFIFDFQHFSWDNLDTRTAAATLKQGQDYHPERLKKAILFKAPTLFWTL